MCVNIKFDMHTFTLRASLNFLNRVSPSTIVAFKNRHKFKQCFCFVVYQNDVINCAYVCFYYYCCRNIDTFHFVIFNLSFKIYDLFHVIL